MGRIWESINASNQHMLTHVPNGQIASSLLCYQPGTVYSQVLNGVIRSVAAAQLSSALAQLRP